MSFKSIESILDRAMSDTDFAIQMLTNPKETLTGYDLTTTELAGFESLSRADFEAFAKATPEERKSFGWNNHNETMLKVRKGTHVNHNESTLKVRKGVHMNHSQSVLKVHMGTHINHNQSALKVRKGVHINHCESALKVRN